MKTLFSSATLQPLATRLRPQSLDEVAGQLHLLAPGKPLRQAAENGMLHSMVLWGPPGTGKTTLARLIARQAGVHFEQLSAILSGVKEIRQLVSNIQANFQQPAVLFIDEIHRFNKAQQDLFLPYLEDGAFILIGATTENPSFELNNALLSRMRVYVLKRLTDEELLTILQRALQHPDSGLNNRTLDFSAALQKLLVQAADGDSRQLLNLLEMLIDLAPLDDAPFVITETLLANVLNTQIRQFDKQGDAFYDLISALHKSVRGSSPDAALYWFCRLLDGGCDPLYLGRRLMRIASEDIGLADPRALEITTSAQQVYERLGSPEGELALAEAVVYLACASKSNAVYNAFNQAMSTVKHQGSLPVPPHLCNAPTALMKHIGKGKNYRYAHDEVHGYAAGENYFPEGMHPTQYYHPVARGLEAKIATRLAYFKSLDEQSRG